MTDDNKIKIGIFDSGLGGLTVLQACYEIFFQESLNAEIEFIYLGDNARVPYGTRSPIIIKKYGTECAKFLLSKSVDYIVVACNTVSAYALDEIRSITNIPVFGTIIPACQKANLLTTNNLIGVIATQATVSSNIFEINLKQLNNSNTIFSVACPLLVPLVEQGMFEGKIVDEVLNLYLTQLRESKIDTLVLGCTHYPLLVDAINKFFNYDIKLVTCSESIAQTLFDSVKNRKIITYSGEKPAIKSKFYVTDELSPFNKLANACIKYTEVNAQLVSVP